MLESRSSARIIISGLALIAILALSVVGESSWGGNVFATVQEFLGVGSSAAPEQAAVTNGKIVFQRGFGTPGAHMFVVDSAGTSEIDFDGGEDPSWRPDGSKIIFSFLRELWMIDSDGTHQQPVKDAAGASIFGENPSWSPDGQKVVFIRNTQAGFPGSIFKMDITVNPDGTVTGSNQVQLTTVTTDAFPAWQPTAAGQNGALIAFQRSAEIFTISSANGANATNITNNPNADRNPNWSPDGTKIVFTSNRAAPNNGDIWKMNPDGTGLVQLTSDTFEDAYPTFSPDGSKIAWSSGSGRSGTSSDRIFVMNADGTGITGPISTSGFDTSPSWGPGSGNSTPTPTPTPTPAIATLSFDGRLRDRVGRSDSGIPVDGDPDGTFTLTLPPSAFSKSFQSIDLKGPSSNEWDTIPQTSNIKWAVGITDSFDTSLFNCSDGSLCSHPTVGSPGTFKLFVSDSNPSSFVQGSTFQVTVTFTDNSTMTASATIQQTPATDLGISMRAPTDAKMVGDRFSYALSLQNYGSILASNVHFTDQLPPNLRLVGLEPLDLCPNQSVVGSNGPLVNCDVSRLNPGQATTIVLTVQAVSAGSLPNSATISSQAIEPSPDAHPNTAAAQVNIFRPTDLRVTINGPTKVNSVDKINYAVDLVNTSVPEQDALGTVLTAVIPPNAVFDSTDSAALGCSGGGTTFTCNIPFAITAGTTLHVRFAVRPLHPGDAALITTKVHVGTSNPDSNLNNNDATSQETAVKIGSDLGITMSGPALVSDGSNATYAIRVTNNGPSLNSGAGVAYQLPTNVDFVSVTPGPGITPQCGLNLVPKPEPNGPNFVQCSLGSIPVGSTFQVNLTVKPKVSGTIFNIVRVGLPSAFLADEFGALAPLFVNPDDLDGNPTNDYAAFSTQTCVSGSGAVPQFEVPNPALLAPAGTKYSYRVRATDTRGGGRITYSLAQGPQGMSVRNMGDGTALLEWTPSTSLIDSHIPVSILASILAPDGSPLCNGGATKSFQVTVTQPIPPGGFCIANGAVKICSDAIVPASGTSSALAKKIALGELRPQDFPSGTYQLGGNTLIGNYLLFTGSLTATVDRAAATLNVSMSGGSLILKSVPIIGDQTLWSGDTMNFTFDANGKLTQFLQGQTDQLHIAGCTIHITAAKLLLTDPNDLGIDITGQLILQDVAGVKGLKASFQDLRIQQRSGVHFTGQIAIPDFDVGGFGVRQVSMDFVASPDGMHDVFSGGGTLITPALTVAGNVTLIGGKLDSVCAAASFPVTGLPLPPIFNISGGGLGISGLQGGPVPERLCGLDTRTYSIPRGFTIFIVADVTIANPVIANVVKLGHAGLIYTAPNKIAVVSDLDVLSTKAASVAIGMEVPINVSIGAEVSLVDSYQVFSLGGTTRPDRTRAPLFSAGLKDDPANPGHLIGYLSASAEARVQIPKMPNPPLAQPGPAIYGLAQAAGVKFPVILAKAGIGFDYPPGAFSADVTFPIIDSVNIVVQKANNGSLITEIGTKFGALPPVNFAPQSTYVTREQTSLSAKNQGGPQYKPGSEGLHVLQTEASAPLSLGSFTIPAKAPKLLFSLSGGATPPRYDLTQPDGTVITPDNAVTKNAVFLQNTDLNESYYVVNDPAAGTWLVMAEDGSQGPFVLNTFGANAPPVLTSVSATQTGNSVQINYNATDADDNAPVSLFYTKSPTEFTGTPLKEGLAKGTSGSYTWNTGDGTVPAGDYYVYAFISDGKNVPQTKFAPTKINVVDALAPVTPQGVSVKPTAGNSLAVSWTPNTEGTLRGYTLLYAVDVGNSTVLNQTFDVGNQTSVRLPQLANNTPYRVSVVAYSQASRPDPDHPGTDLVTTHTSTPSAAQSATTGIANPPLVQITSPNGGELIGGNNDLTVSWNLMQEGDVVNQTIEVSIDNGVTYNPVIQTLDKSVRNYVWHVPTSVQGAACLVRVTALDSSGNTASDTSDASFTFTLAEGTLVSISGRVVTPDGRGLRNATVSMTDPDGVVRTATTSSFGLYSFTNVAVGNNYTVRVLSRLYRFSPRNVALGDNLVLPDFVGLE